MTPRWPQRGLYAITPDDPDTGRLLARVEPVLAAGVSLLQYRNKSVDAANRRLQAVALLVVCARHGVPLVINDDWRLAADIGADGAHLGQDDGELMAAREQLGPSAILGASCYDSLQLAHAAVNAGSSYIAFGAFFPSPTKPHARQASLDLLHDSAPLGVPRVAIGGITPENGRVLVRAGCDMLAVISGVFDAPDPVAAVQAYGQCFDADVSAGGAT
ncbi:thiamine phosphate synthase [Lysobacter olei]